MLSGGVVEDVESISMRPIPLRRYHWSTVPWISETGILRRRHFNARLSEWHWELKTVAPSLDRRGRIGHRLQNQFYTLAQLIALAWLERPTPMKRMSEVLLTHPEDGLVSYNLRYRDSFSREDDDSDDDISIVDPDEVWLPLECKVGIVPCVESGYHVSNRRRLRSPNGKISIGNGGLGGYFFLISGIPPIPAERATSVLFDPTTKREKPPPRIRATMAQLNAGASIKRLAHSLKIKQTTAWSYAHAAMRFVSTSTARSYTTQLLADPNVVPQFRVMIEKSPDLLHAPLRTIVDVFTREWMAVDLNWRSNAHRYAEMSALRALLQRE